MMMSTRDELLTREFKLMESMVSVTDVPCSTEDRRPCAVVALDLGEDGTYYFSAAAANSLGLALNAAHERAAVRNMERAPRPHAS